MEADVEEAKGDEIDAGILDMSIEDLELSARAYNCLKKVGAKTVRDLLEYSLEDLMAIKHFGAKSATEVRDKLLEFNLKLKGAEIAEGIGEAALESPEKEIEEETEEIEDEEEKE
jgi:DNA-directed RNA polymerase subunit alpha